MYAWGDNDHGQQGNNTTAVNKRPQLVSGFEDHKITRVACGSSHSIAWAESDLPRPTIHEPVMFPVARDPLGASCLTPKASVEKQITMATDVISNEISGKRHRPSLAKIVLSLNSNHERQQSLSHILTSLQIMYARDSVVEALMDSKAFLSTDSKTSPRDDPADKVTSLMSVSEVALDDITLTVSEETSNKQIVEGLDEFTGILGREDARLLVELLKLAVANRTGEHGKDVLSRVLRALAQGRSEVSKNIVDCICTVARLSVTVSLLSLCQQ